MIPRLSYVALVATLLTPPLTSSLSPSEIPSDTPIASLVSSAKSNLAKGNANDAITYFDAAISRDPTNYLTIFQRGAAYLSLGRNEKASSDFDRVLTIRPDFEGALLQRAKIKSRNADWGAAKDDYVRAKKTGSADYVQLEEAWGAASLAMDAEKAGDWEGCIGHAGTAILVASKALSLREVRARCRFERGEVLEGVSDLAHVLQISPSSIKPHMQISSMMFYSMGDTTKGVEQLQKCLRSDPDSKACSKSYRRQKRIMKTLKQVSAFQEKRQYNSAVKLLIGSKDDPGLIQDIKEDVKEAKDAGHIHKNSPNDLYSSLVEMTCDFYQQVMVSSYPFLLKWTNIVKMNNKKKAQPYCAESLTINPQSLPALILKAENQLDAEDFDAAISTLNTAKEHHPSAQNVQSLLQKAHTLLKRSKTKDYYKVLGVANDADDRTIKKTYRSLTRQYHPDKAAAQGMSKEQAERKMADVNEAYEILKDPELRARFDRGDDPNNPEHQGRPFQGSPFGQGPGGQQFFFREGGGRGGGFKFQAGGGGGGFQFPGGFGF